MVFTHIIVVIFKSVSQWSDLAPPPRCTPFELKSTHIQISTPSILSAPIKGFLLFSSIAMPSEYIETICGLSSSQNIPTLLSYVSWLLFLSKGTISTNKRSLLFYTLWYLCPVQKNLAHIPDKWSFSKEHPSFMSQDRTATQHAKSNHYRNCLSKMVLSYLLAGIICWTWWMQCCSQLHGFCSCFIFRMFFNLAELCTR